MSSSKQTNPANQNNRMENQNEKVNQSSAIESNEQTDDFDETDSPNDDSLRKEIIAGFDRDWNNCDPLTAPLLAAVRQKRRAESKAALVAFRQREAAREFQRNASSADLALTFVPTTDDEREIDDREINDDDPTDRLLDSVNRAALPFHHLIPAAPLASAFAILESPTADRKDIDSRQRRQLFWQSLAAAGVSAKEAALFDDSLPCRFIEYDGSRLTEINWEVFYFDELQGCREIYLAEMFLCKRRIYEAGDNLRAVLELTDADLSGYLPGENSPLAAEKILELLLDCLAASFNLTVNRIAAHPSEAKRGAKGNCIGDWISSHITHGANRTETWMGERRTTAGGETGTHRVGLADYWLDWQRAARLADFDFDYLHTLTDARAVRFYELTKLWRVAPGHKTHEQIPDRLEIEYEKFTSLMPLPPAEGEREIKWQIGELIRPLKKDGYVKSFRVKPDWGSRDRRAKLVFRFDD